MTAETQEPKRGRGRPRQEAALVEAPHLVRRVLTVKEFGACVGLSASSVLKLIEANHVRFIANPAGGKRIPIEEVDAYLRRNLKEIGPRKAPAPAEAKGEPAPRAARPAGAAVGPDGVSRLRRRG